jgi:hypothetical protein
MTLSNGKWKQEREKKREREWVEQDCNNDKGLEKNDKN